MLFNSYEFLLFFPIVTIIFFLLPHRLRWAHLLIASFVFYMAFLPVYVFILLITIIVDYFAGIYIYKSTGPRRKYYLVYSLIANIGFLCFFKYYDFIIGNLNAAFAIHIPYLRNLWLTSWIITANNAVNTHLNASFGTEFSVLRQIILPIGLSFHTFQAMSYIIEVYRGNQKPERHFGIYALYVMFYPQLVAGPIERPQNVLHQFHERKIFSMENLLAGLRLVAWGLLKKVVVADRIAQYVNIVYAAPEGYHWMNVVIATIFFAVQIYCDFSGYSDMAVGMARIMGYDLMINFNRPYMAHNIKQFWARWHISLSSWFRDYLYIPLGGNRVSFGRYLMNFAIVFIVSGIWHGADWTFIIWGLLHAIYTISFIIFNKYMVKKQEKNVTIPLWRKAISWFITFFLVCFAWIFFRASDLGNAFKVIKQVVLLKAPQAFKRVLINPDGITGFGYTSLLLTLIFGVYIFWFEAAYRPRLLELNERPVQDILFMAFTLISIIAFGNFTRENFIYFQF